MFMCLGAAVVVACVMWYGMLFVLCCVCLLFVCVVCLCGPFVVSCAVLHCLVHCLAFECVFVCTVEHVCASCL